MFRKGGSAGEGITSGLAPRQGYQDHQVETYFKQQEQQLKNRSLILEQAEQLTTKA